MPSSWATAGTYGPADRRLAGLPEQRRRLLPICLGYRAADGHTCMIEHLDPMADRSAGSWRRRRDHLAQLTAE
jgi:hypothetical protein